MSAKPFGVIPPEPKRITSLTGLAPAFAAKVVELLERMRAKGHDPVVFESVRTEERQQWLYGFSREYDDGRGNVTKVPTALKGWHIFGLAVDIISISRGWDESYVTFWTDLRAIATEIGLRSGDDWDRDGIPVEADPDEHWADKPHVQWYCDGMRVTPSDHAAQLFRERGVEAVWREVRAA